MTDNSSSKNQVHILGGGTVNHVRPHLALTAPAYGYSARIMGGMAREKWNQEADVFVHLTRMACGDQKAPETNADVGNLLRSLVAIPETKVIFMSAALCDFTGSVLENGISTHSGKDAPRLKSRNGDQLLQITPADKLIASVRQFRKDVFLVGFKTTAGYSEDQQYFAGLELLKKNSCNLVLANDLHTKRNMIITPEQARYHITVNRQDALRNLVDMTYSRSKLHFTRSTIVSGQPVSWRSEAVPDSLRKVVDFCIQSGAYKPFLGSTVGHFAVKLGDGKFLTSRRKTDFNKLDEVGLVLVEARGLDEVVAFGSKPSVGGQSQRIIFTEHPDADCIVHFHCPKKPDSKVPVRSQREYECGSHECGKNTSDGLQKFGNLYAVMLDQHGPNVVFNRNTDPNEVIQFIKDNFILEGRTDEVTNEWLVKQYAHAHA